MKYGRYFSKGNVLAVLVVAAIVWYLFTGRLPHGYIFAGVGPSQAYALSNPDISIAPFTLLEKQMQIDVSDSWKMHLRDSNTFMRGVNQIIISTDREIYEQDYPGIVVNFDVDGSSLSISRIYLEMDGVEYSSIKTVEDCGSRKSLENIEQSVPNYDVLDNLIKQSIKRIDLVFRAKNLQASLYPIPYLVCTNGELALSPIDSVTLSTQSFDLHLSSWVTYQWDSKGGTTYRL